MTEKNRNICSSPIIHHQFRSWGEFIEYMDKGFGRSDEYIFRGQKDFSWKLSPVLDRKLGGRIQTTRPDRHFATFRRACLGRRGVNPPVLGENELWALGQHYGLWTPLLDWTESPFIALYFAFDEVNEHLPSVRAVFALNTSMVRIKSATISENSDSESPERPDIIEVLNPEVEENARLINQKGVFTRCNPGVDVESWITGNLGGAEPDQTAALYKFEIVEQAGDRDDVLLHLAKYNIHHGTLFPDITGSAQFSNRVLVIDGYH